MSAPVLGYYGKLPVSREFLRLHAAGPELRELDEWLQQGVQYAKAQAGPGWPELLAQADIWNFLFVPEGNGRAVCGAIFASQDEAGRSFPFLTFLLLDRHDFLAAPWLIPLACHAFLATSRQCLQQLRTDLDWNAFRTTVESLPATIDTDASIALGFDTYLAHTTIRGFWDGMQATANLGQPEERGHTRALPEDSAGERSCVNGYYGLKLPLLNRGTDKSYDLPFWLELHTQLCEAKKGTVPALIAFWNRTPSKVEPCALLSFGRSSPNLTRFLVSPDRQDDAWSEWWPPAVSPQPKLPGRSPSSAMPVADKTDVSLRHYLDMIR